MTEELVAARALLNQPRLTRIVDYAADIDDESLIAPASMIVTLTRDGYVKRTPLDVFRSQHRGGRGRSAASTRADDVVVRSFVGIDSGIVPYALLTYCAMVPWGARVTTVGSTVISGTLPKKYTKSKYDSARTNRASATSRLRSVASI